MNGPAPRNDLPAVLDRTTAEAIVADAARRWAVRRRVRIRPFVDRHFTLRGSARLHRHAFGPDLVKAPLNMAMAAPQLGLRVLERLAMQARNEKLANLFGRHDLMTATAVGRELAWALHTELLDLPIDQGNRVHTRDSFAEAILADPRLRALLAESADLAQAGAGDPERAARVARVLDGYAATRVAASEIATGLLSLAAGAGLFHQFTPGVLSLAPALAGAVVARAAAAAAPAGALMPFLPLLAPGGPAAMAATGGALILFAALSGGLAGVVADPVQRRLGLHDRRLTRMVERVEAALAGRDVRFEAHDHYVARLLDVFDIVRSLRMAAGR